MLILPENLKYFALRYLLCLGFVFSFGLKNTFGQIKKNLSYEIGTGFQFSKTKIKNSEYVSMFNKPIPKLFFGINYTLPINEKTLADIGAVFNYSRFENRLNFTSKEEDFIFNSSLIHNDFNYGISLGIKRKSELKKSNLTINGGVKFQKVSVYKLGYIYHFESKGADSTKYTFQEDTKSNYIEKDANSLGYYISCGLKPKKRKLEFILELSGTLNNPYYFGHKIYYQEELIEQVDYKTNLHFGVIKIRKYF